MSDDVALSATESETIWASKHSVQGACILQFIGEMKIFKSVQATHFVKGGGRGGQRGLVAADDLHFEGGVDDLYSY